ncbi:vesicular glutamate transporter 3-like [Planococcus citri]|uniref:vesicular glutamate transporter 3-like n=1 Tax=Planococcus citri TaxID=170843 RepID=UPI0031F974E1
MQEYSFWFSKRFLVGILAFFGEMNIFTLRGNLNIAILDMTSSKNITVNGTTTTQGPEFDWDEPTKGFILGAYAWGSLLSPIGGYLAMRYGGSTVISISTLVMSIMTMFTPMILHSSYYLFVAARLIEGVTECFRFVSFPELWTQWSPLRDRSRLMALTLSGLYAGPAIMYPIFGYLTKNYGWPSTFYFSGAFSLLWTVIWMILVPNTPEEDKWISKDEVRYIRQDPHKSRPKNMVSLWKNIILSKEVQALGIARMIQDFGLVITVTFLPTLIKDLTGSDLEEVGVLSAIPTIVNIFTVPVVGWLLDYFRNNDCLTTTQAHKIFACGAFLFGGGILLTISNSSYNFVFMMVCLSFFKAAVSVMWIICNINIIVLAPKCSSALASYISFFHMLGSAIAPFIITFIVTTHTPYEWNTCFYTFGIISFCGAVIFFLFGSGEPQPWSFSTERTTPTREEINEKESLNYCSS